MPTFGGVFDFCSATPESQILKICHPAVKSAAQEESGQALAMAHVKTGRGAMEPKSITRGEVVRYRRARQCRSSGLTSLATDVPAHMQSVSRAIVSVASNVPTTPSDMAHAGCAGRRLVGHILKSFKALLTRACCTMCLPNVKPPEKAKDRTQRLLTDAEIGSLDLQG